MSRPTRNATSFTRTLDTDQLHQEKGIYKNRTAPGTNDVTDDGRLAWLRSEMADTCANPLLLGWIKEWLDQARERNSKGFTVFVLTLSEIVDLYTDCF